MPVNNLGLEIKVIEYYNYNKIFHKKIKLYTEKDCKQKQKSNEPFLVKSLKFTRKHFMLYFLFILYCVCRLHRKRFSHWRPNELINDLMTKVHLGDSECINDCSE